MKMPGTHCKNINHAQPNVETSVAGSVVLPDPWLQWSHAQPNVETAVPDSSTGRYSCCFNGATLSRTWKRCRGWVGLLRPSGFNGATLSRTWKRSVSPRVTVGANRLQWSHAQPNVETRQVLIALNRVKHASTEPRSAERGNRHSSTRQGRVGRASMEPRSAERGNAAWLRAKEKK